MLHFAWSLQAPFLSNHALLSSICSKQCGLQIWKLHSVVDVPVFEQHAAAYGLGAATSRVVCIKKLASLFTVTQWEHLRGISHEYFRHYLLFENCKTFFCILNLHGVATECGILNFLHEFATKCRLLIFALYADALIISQQVWIFPLWYASCFPFSHHGINHKQYYCFILKCK